MVESLSLDYMPCLSVIAGNISTFLNIHKNNPWLNSWPEVLHCSKEDDLLGSMSILSSKVVLLWNSSLYCKKRASLWLIIPDASLILMGQSIWSFNISPSAIPRHLNFCRLVCSNSCSPAWNFVQIPHPSAGFHHQYFIKAKSATMTLKKWTKL